MTIHPHHPTTFDATTTNGDREALLRPLPAFPESVLQPRAMRWRRRLRIIGVGAVVAAVVSGGVLVARQVTADVGLELRTTAAATQTVAEHYRAVAAIEPVMRAAVTFPMSGTVESVDVAVGDTVEIGDTLASIDTAALQQAVRQAESELATAQLTLNIALAGEDPSTSGVGGLSGGAPAVGVSMTGGAVFGFASASVDAYTYALASTSDEVVAARQAVVAAQSAVTTAGNTVAAKRDTAVSICAAVNVTVDPDDPEGSIGTISSSLGACQAALDELMAAQDALTAAQNQLTAAADTLDGLLGAWANELENNTTSTTTPATTTTTPDTTPETTTPPTETTTPESTTVPTTETTTPDDPTTSSTVSGQDAERPGGDGPDGGAPTGGGTPNGGGMPGGGAPSGGSASSGAGAGATVEAREPTAAELIAYQAAYDAAGQSLEAARQALAQTTIVSPIAGTVVAVGLALGDDVTASSDTQTIVVRGENGYEATLSASVDDIDRIAVGQTADLLPDGGGAAVAGQVVAISEVPDSSGTTASYRVTVGLAGDTARLRDGNIGDVAIVVATRDNTLAVPTSAVTPTAAGYTVDVVDADGQVSTVQVEVGAIGTEWTEIRRGVEVGETVVIAHLDEPLPGPATDSSNGTSTGTGGGFPGGGGVRAGGGFPGGRFPGGPPGG